MQIKGILRSVSSICYGTFNENSKQFLAVINYFLKKSRPKQIKHFIQHQNFSKLGEILIGLRIFKVCKTFPVDTGRESNVFWTSYVRRIYVLCLLGCKNPKIKKKIALIKFVSEQIFSQHLITWKCKNFHVELVRGVFYPTFAVCWNQMTNFIIKNSMSITSMRNMFLNSKRALILSSLMILLPLPN